MARVKRGVTAKRRHKKVLEQAKGYTATRAARSGRRTSRLLHAGSTPSATGCARRSVPAAVDPADQRRHPHPRHELQPVHRRAQRGGIEVDRKILADLAVHDAAAFGVLVEAAKGALATSE